MPQTPLGSSRFKRSKDALRRPKYITFGTYTNMSAALQNCRNPRLLTFISWNTAVYLWLVGSCGPIFSLTFFFFIPLKVNTMRHFRTAFLPRCQNESSYESMLENVFQLQVHFHTKQTHFHVKGFTQSLVLKQRHKGTRNSFYRSYQRFNMRTGHCIDPLASFVCLSKQLNI